MPPLAVPLARPAPIDDRALALLRRIAHDCRNSLSTEAEAEWLLASCGALLDELAQRRVAMAAITPAMDLSNVIILDAVR